MFQRYLPLLCLIQIVFMPRLQAGERKGTILPHEWRPDLAAAREWLENDLTETQAQQGMNRLSRCLADLKDADLFAVYVRL
jgi:hypothetical protein